MEENKSIVKKDVGTQVLDRINALCETGLKLPADYSATNAIKASMLNLMEAKDKNGAPALQVCTQSSVQSALFEMATKGLDVSKKQAYFIVRGNKLCLHVSYFGNILQVKRLYPDWEPVANTIREGDEFVYTIDPATGKKKLVKHEQKIENLDNALIGAYTYLPSKTGDNELYVMTKKQILTAWSKSPNKNLSTHKEFDEKMALKTILIAAVRKSSTLRRRLSSLPMMMMISIITKTQSKVEKSRSRSSNLRRSIAIFQTLQIQIRIA